MSTYTKTNLQNNFLIIVFKFTSVQYKNTTNVLYFLQTTQITHFF